MSARLICGLQPVREAIRAHGGALARVVIETDGARPTPQLDALARYAHDRGARVERAQRAELDRMARGVRHQGAIAFASELRFEPLDRLNADQGALVVALDEVQDPQNFGAVIRSAVGMGATAVVWPEHRSAPLSPATFRASAGAVEHATLCRVPSLPPALQDLRARGLFVVGLDMGGPASIDRVDLARGVVLVVGAEGKGLRKTVKRACEALVRVPMADPLGSLNASVAVAIGLYEVLRQRGRADGGPHA
ncbi:MAG TPA: 23S rRNA (guanosine(2251)-2'-O)-methyltransferase RlmB [Polyangiaceae bacterium]|nr:23S rRNA (guanosine(2251)-2'-O)-methyltransferase RlmB [Polyangiaceae bacterium]